ncbi:MAG TPA: dTMP kinase [Thermoanaerobaculia bacterium]|jgi:dTMP kinase
MPFVTFEGVEGCGKSTQLARAAARLRERGKAVLQTREPGGTAIGERLRAVLLDASRRELDGTTEWLLIEADRRQHVREVLRPAVAAGTFVLCDRFSDSTEAYQQAGRGIDPAAVALVDGLARDGLNPDLTLLYDLEPEAGLARAKERDGPHVGRFEAADLSFHRAVRAAYLEIARREPRRVVLIRSDGDADAVFRDTWRHIAERFSL